MGMTPPVSEMPVAVSMRRPRRRCGNCLFAEDCGDRETVACRRDGRGFDNHPVPNRRFPAGRGPCINHQYRRNPA